MLGPEADDEWQDMPIERSDQGLGAPFEPMGGESSSDESDEAPTTSANRVARGMRVQEARRAHLYSSPRGETRRARNITGRHLDVHDVRGFDWREKPSDLDPSAAEGKKEAELAYTQLRLDEDEEEEDLNAATEYLFHEDLAQIEHGDDPSATPISQLAMTKKLLSEPQKIAYVGLCSITAHNMLRLLHTMDPKDTRGACRSGDEWLIRVMVRLYQHLDIDVQEQSMIESLSQHGILASDLAGSLIMTHTIANPAYDPNEAKEAREAEEARAAKEAKEAEEREKVEEEARGLRDSEDAKESRRAQEAWEAKGEARASWDPSKEQAESLDTETPVEQGAPEQTEADNSRDAQAGTPEKRSEEQASAPPGDTQTPHTPTQGSATSPRSKLPRGAPHTPAEDTSTSQPSVLVDPNTAAQVAGGTDTSPMGPGATAPVNSVSGPGRTYPQPAEAPRTTLEGVTTEMSASNKTITLDLRWTVLCDLFLVLTADSVYDARSRVLLERVAEALGLTSMDVTKFEKRITDTLQIEEDVQSLEDRQIFSKHERARRNKRLAMMGLATVGGGLVIGLSAGLLAPLIGAGMGSALATIGIGSVAGNSLIFGGVGGATVITTTGTLGGATLGARGMQRRTRNVKTFEFRPIHNHKRVNCIVTVPGFLRGSDDDPTLPFGVLDSVMGDAFSIMWEPEMMQEMGNAMSILWNETLVQGMQQVLAATVAPAMFSALAWPLWLTKLGYLIDNPWSNALERSRAAGLILADVLRNRQLGVRPITLVGFSLGARMIFFALQELARMKAFGVVQDVCLMGAPVSAREQDWLQVRSVVSGRFVNAFSRTDWILSYLHRATSGGLVSIAGLRPVTAPCEIENVDVTHLVPGHLAYRSLTPLVLSEVGFKTTADYFDEPESLEDVPEREVLFEQDEPAAAPKTTFGTIASVFRRNSDSSKEKRTAERTAASLKAALKQTSAANDARQAKEKQEDDYEEPERMEEPRGTEPAQSPEAVATAAAAAAAPGAAPEAATAPPAAPQAPPAPEAETEPTSHSVSPALSPAAGAQSLPDIQITEKLGSLQLGTASVEHVAQAPQADTWRKPLQGERTAAAEAPAASADVPAWPMPTFSGGRQERTVELNLPEMRRESSSSSGTVDWTAENPWGK